MDDTEISTDTETLTDQATIRRHNQSAGLFMFYMSLLGLLIIGIVDLHKGDKGTGVTVLVGGGVLLLARILYLLETMHACIMKQSSNEDASPAVPST